MYLSSPVSPTRNRGYGYSNSRLLNLLLVLSFFIIFVVYVYLNVFSSLTVKNAEFDMIRSHERLSIGTDSLLELGSNAPYNRNIHKIMSAWIASEFSRFYQPAERVSARNLSVTSGLSRIGTFGDLGIDSIVFSGSKFHDFDAFSVDSGINVWDLFPPMTNCPDSERIGRVGDGGKWLCGLSWLSSHFPPSRPPADSNATLQRTRFESSKLTKHNRVLRECIVYSFGISSDASFEEEILDTTSCNVYAFDPTIGDLPNPLFMNASTWAALKGDRIRFNKIALGIETGSNEEHALNEHLYDIMHRYNHSYIDILKIDIEGNILFLLISMNE